MKLTRQQIEAVHGIYLREKTSYEIDDHRKLARSYMQVRRSVVPGFGCVMLPWCGMWLGIEPDGYTHS